MSSILVLESCSSSGKVVLTNVVTQHNDNFGTGAYLLETRLTPANVSTDFGLLYSRTEHRLPLLA